MATGAQGYFLHRLTNSVTVNAMPEIDKISLAFDGVSGATLNFILDYAMARQIIDELSSCLPEKLVNDVKIFT